jgi:hypothetical protein
MFSNAQWDLYAMILLILLSLIVSGIVMIFAKRKSNALILFSILANASVFLLLLMGTPLFDFYGIKFLAAASFYIWPIINLYLIIKFFAKR